MIPRPSLTQLNSRGRQRRPALARPPRGSALRLCSGGDRLGRLGCLGLFLGLAFSSSSALSRSGPSPAFLVVTRRCSVGEGTLALRLAVIVGRRNTTSACSCCFLSAFLPFLSALALAWHRRLDELHHREPLAARVELLLRLRRPWPPRPLLLVLILESESPPPWRPSERGAERRTASGAARIGGADRARLVVVVVVALLLLISSPTAPCRAAVVVGLGARALRVTLRVPGVGVASPSAARLISTAPRCTMEASAGGAGQADRPATRAPRAARRPTLTAPPA